MNWPWAIVIIFTLPTLLIAGGVLNEMYLEHKQGTRVAEALNTDSLRESLDVVIKDEDDKEVIMLLVERWLTKEGL